MFFEQMHPSWQAAIPDSKSILENLEAKLEARGTHYLPEKHLVMRAFEAPLDNIRVVIIGPLPNGWARNRAVFCRFERDQAVAAQPKQHPSRIGR
jgi:uracil DNA glycosylase